MVAAADAAGLIGDVDLPSRIDRDIDRYRE
jgi:hypothetical protein